MDPADYAALHYCVIGVYCVQHLFVIRGKCDFKLNISVYVLYDYSGFINPKLGRFAGWKLPVGTDLDMETQGFDAKNRI